MIKNGEEIGDINFYIKTTTSSNISNGVRDITDNEVMWTVVDHLRDALHMNIHRFIHTTVCLELSEGKQDSL